MGKKKGKNPMLAAILNFIWPGIGYLYIGKRKAFGAIVAFSMLVGVYELYFTDIYNTMLIPSMAIFGLAFAYDAYKEASG